MAIRMFFCDINNYSNLIFMYRNTWNIIPIYAFVKNKILTICYVYKKENKCDPSCVRFIKSMKLSSEKSIR